MTTSRYSVDLQAKGGLKMTHDMAEIIYDQIIYYESLGLKQLQVVLIGGNTVREDKKPTQTPWFDQKLLEANCGCSRLALGFWNFNPISRNWR